MLYISGLQLIQHLPQNISLHDSSLLHVNLSEPREICGKFTSMPLSVSVRDIHPGVLLCYLGKEEVEEGISPILPLFLANLV